MQHRMTRRGFALSTALLAVGVTDAGAANEEELAWLRLGASAELVAEAFSARAARSAALSAAARRRFAEARAADHRHYEALVAVIGPDAPTPADFSIGFPARTFASRSRLIEVGLRVKRAIVGLNLGAAAAAGDDRLRALVARISVGESAHVAYLTSLAGRSVLRDALPKAIQQEEATARLAPFWN